MSEHADIALTFGQQQASQYVAVLLHIPCCKWPLHSLLCLSLSWPHAQHALDDDSLSESQNLHLDLNFTHMQEPPAGQLDSYVYRPDARCRSDAHR